MNLRFLTILIVIFFLEPPSSINAQVGIGQWRDHLPYSKYTAIANTNDRIYAATPYGLVYLNKSDQSVQRLNKINGLSDNRISDIGSSQSNTLIIAYRNTNLDLIKGKTVINLSDIKRKSIIGNKFINKIHIEGELAYLACGFGIVIIDLLGEEVKDTYLIGAEASHVNVQDIVLNDTAIFAATDQGLYSASLSSANLADFSNWKLVSNIPSINQDYNLIESFGGKIVLNNRIPGYNTDKLYVFDGISWANIELGLDISSDQYSLKKQDDYLLICRNTDLLVLNQNLELEFTIESLQQKTILPSDAVFDASNEIWIADRQNGLIKTSNKGASSDFIQIEGPFSPDVYKMGSINQQLWVASGGRDIFWAPQYKREGFYSFEDEKWTSYNCPNQDCDYPILDSIRDMVNVAINPFDQGNVYIGTWQSGIIELLNSEIIEVYTDQNSSIRHWAADPEKILISGMDFDDNGNLWVANSGAENILSVKTFDGDWKSFNLGTANTNIDISDILVDQSNQKWIIPRRARSLIVFDDNNTPLDQSDDQIRSLTSAVGNGALFASNTYCIAEDLDGEIWLGTNKGIGVIYSPQNVFRANNFDVYRIIVQWDAYTQYLLETELITSIAVDAANRKWIGTQNSGVFLLSEDGQEQIHHFTSDNSPLFSNTISDIEILKDGEVFIGTSEGLISYRASAAKAGNTTEDVYAFPNPVPIGYSGSIAIKNLYQDANVKITDISGNLVFETYALGGQAIWNGRSFDGEKAHSGVYMVFASSQNGSFALVTKILIIN